MANFVIFIFIVQSLTIKELIVHAAIAIWKLKHREFIYLFYNNSNNLFGL